MLEPMRGVEFRRGLGLRRELAHRRAREFRRTLEFAHWLDNRPSLELTRGLESRNLLSLHINVRATIVLNSPQQTLSRNTDPALLVLQSAYSAPYYVSVGRQGVQCRISNHGF